MFGTDCQIVCKNDECVSWLAELIRIYAANEAWGKCRFKTCEPIIFIILNSHRCYPNSGQPFPPNAILLVIRRTRQQSVDSQDKFIIARNSSKHMTCSSWQVKSASYQYEGQYDNDV